MVHEGNVGNSTLGTCQGYGLSCKLVELRNEARPNGLHGCSDKLTWGLRCTVCGKMLVRWGIIHRLIGRVNASDYLSMLESEDLTASTSIWPQYSIFLSGLKIEHEMFVYTCECDLRIFCEKGCQISFLVINQA